MPFAIEVQCADCEHIRTIYLDKSTAPPDPEDEKCPECGSTNFSRCLGASYNVSNDPAVRSEMLKKRSLDHTIRTAKDNVERIIENRRKGKTQ